MDKPNRWTAIIRNATSALIALVFVLPLYWAFVASLGQTGEFLLPFNDTNGWLARARTSLSFPITDAWAFENSLTLEYLNDAPPLTDEFTLDYIVSLVYSF